MLLKSFFSLIIIFCLYSTAQSQSSQTINYQAVARSSSGGLLMDQNISIRFTLIDGPMPGNTIYAETHIITTNQYGLFTLEIGGGMPVEGVFASIDWSVGDMFLKVEMDQFGGDNYTELGINKMLAVPYAMHSGTTTNTNDADADPENELQTLTKDGNLITLSDGGGTVTDEVDDADAYPTNEIQRLSFNDGMLTISDGNTVDLSVRNTAINDLVDGKSDATSVFLGANAGSNDDKTNNNNTGVGIKTLAANTEGYENTASGYAALFSNTTGDQNTANGNEALFSNTTGNNNTASGYRALASNSTGYYNTAFGNEALFSNISGHYNTAIGYATLFSNSTGHHNTAIGSSTLYNNSTGYYNTASGYEALNSNTTGYFNTAIGYRALPSNTTGYNNIAIGYAALISNRDGYHNTAIGFWAGPSNSNLSNTTALGSSASATESNMVRIGNASVTSIGGQVEWTSISDGRFKENVIENVPGLDFIINLRPVTYNLNVNGIAQFLGEDRHGPQDAFTVESRNAKSQITYTGFIAQEVEQTASAAGYDFSGVDKPQNEGSLYGLRYAQFVVPLVKAVQEQQIMINELLSQMANIPELEDENDEHSSQLTQIQELKAENERQNILNEEQSRLIEELIFRLNKLENSTND